MLNSGWKIIQSVRKCYAPSSVYKNYLYKASLNIIKIQLLNLSNSFSTDVHIELLGFFFKMLKHVYFGLIMLI